MAENHASNKTPLDRLLEQKPDSESASDGADLIATLNALQADKELQQQTSQQLEDKAKEAEHDGADPYVAAHLHQDASRASSLANEAAQLMSEVKADPSKKVIRRKVDSIRQAITTATVQIEQDTVVAHGAHVDNAEHKDAMHIAANEQLTHDRKPEPEKKPTHKQPHMEPMQKTGKAHGAPKITAPHSSHTGHSTVKQVLHKGWETTKHVVTGAYGVIKKSVHAVGHTLESVGGAIGSVVSGVGHFCAPALEVLAHPITAVTALSSGAMDKLHGLASMAMKLLPFGHGREESVLTVTAHAAKPNLNGQAMAAAKKLILPAGITGGKQEDHEDMLSPNAWMNLLPSLPDLGVS